MPASGESPRSARVKCELEQVADRLLEAGEDQIRTALRHLSHEQLERRCSGRPSPRLIAGHHGQLVKVGERTQGFGVGPERDGRLEASSRSPARLGRNNRRSTSGIDVSAACSRGIDIQKHRQTQSGGNRTNRAPSRWPAGSARLPRPCLAGSSPCRAPPRLPDRAGSSSSLKVGCRSIVTLRD